MRPAYTMLDHRQRSPEWFAARAGRLTGSCAAKAIDFKKNGDESEKRKALRLRLVCERLTGRAEDDDAFVTRELQRGIYLEPAAAAAYEAASSQAARWSGFLSHNELMVGCSLDGHVGDPIVGTIEIKCPKATTHLSYLEEGRVPTDYLPQITHNLWISGAAWCDFVSYDDRFPEPFQLFIVRVLREQVDVDDYEQHARAFLAEVERDLHAVTVRRQPVLEGVDA